MAILIASFTEPFNSISGMDGSIGMMDHGSKWSEMNIFAELVYSVGDMVCHQEMSRSFVMNGNQLTVCSRDLFILFGIFTGLLFFQLLPKKAEDRRLWYVSYSFVVLMLIDWGVQYITSTDVMITRIITGMMCGIAIATILEKMMIRMEHDAFETDD